MASKFDAVWAIDLGNSSLKALHLSAESGVVEVIGFDNIQHGKILTGAGVTEEEKDELIALSLRRFVKQNDLGRDDIVISVPSQHSFARFVNLPPVEAKRIPEIVKFEAAQQIPFDINEVQWDWQLMTEGDSPENKVGIFAIKNDVVNSALGYFGAEDVTVGYVQMVPMALYNYVLYDRPDLFSLENQAIVALDIGAENTDLVVCTKSTVWQRCIPMGGNAFTRAIADAFKLNFERAEKLKRTAPMSKYARQILQAMRPVFMDLASEIQRSLGFYTSSNPNTKLLKVIAFGGGTKMRGLLKYLRQTLQMPIERPDSFKKLAIGSGVSAAKFHENVSDFGIIYGLALQGLGLAKIESNLLPRSIARSMVWGGKVKYFTAAACALLLVSVLSFGRTLFDKASYGKHEKDRSATMRIIIACNQAGEKLKAEKIKGAGSKAIIQKAFESFKHRNVIPLLHQIIISTLPNEENNPEQKELYRAFANRDVETVMQTRRKERKQIFVTGMSVHFVADVETAGFDATDLRSAASKKKKGEGFLDERAISELRMFGRGPATKYDKEFYLRPGQKLGAAEETKPGFVVTITGYSPYKNLGELLEPVGVKDHRNKWGVVTRLIHLDDIVDGNSPFELYEKTEEKTELEHFKLDYKPIDLDGEMPPGIIGVGDTELGESGEQVLIDPMTKEIIGKVAKLDGRGKKRLDGSGKVVYEVNDQWFILNAKFIWKDAPKKSAAKTAAPITGSKSFGQKKGVSKRAKK
jgi:type IV pilus assembly protein PilM